MLRGRWTEKKRSKYIYIYIYTSRHPSNWLPTCQGPKNDAKRQKTSQKYQNCLKIKGKNDAKICPQILVAVVIRFFSRYDFQTYIAASMDCSYRKVLNVSFKYPSKFISRQKTRQWISPLIYSTFNSSVNVKNNNIIFLCSTILTTNYSVQQQHITLFIE